MMFTALVIFSMNKMQERNQIFNLLPPYSGLETSFHSPSRQLPLWVCKSEDKKIPDDI